MNVEEYLERIRYDGPREPTADTLTRLHRAHMLTVPFENLDIPLGRPIVLDLPSIYAKIVRRRRGGFCYELNGLFAWLLDRIGFEVRMHSARVFDGAAPGPEFDHMVLRVDAEARMIADVGFGDSFRDPLRLEAGEEVVQQDGAYRLRGSDAEWTLDRRRDTSWEPQYVFTSTPRAIGDFAAMCRYQQTSPDSPFTRKAVCSLATPDGRITLSNGRLITTMGGRRLERPVEDEAEYRALLLDRFGVRLDAAAPVGRLMAAGREPGPAGNFRRSGT